MIGWEVVSRMLNDANVASCGVSITFSPHWQLTVFVSASFDGVYCIFNIIVLSDAAFIVSSSSSDINATGRDIGMICISYCVNNDMVCCITICRYYRFILAPPSFSVPYQRWCCIYYPKIDLCHWIICRSRQQALTRYVGREVPRWGPTGERYIDSFVSACREVEKLNHMLADQ
jgi:hypothetical protein